MTVTARHFIDNAPQATLTVAMNTTDTSVSVGSLAGFPTGFPYYATLDIGTASAEVVKVTAAVGSTATVVRNANGLGAFAHSATSGTFTHTSVALDFQDANDHHVATGAVHGVTGSLVGTTDTQTLSGKTLTSPVINGGSVNNASTVTATGALSGATVAATGNATVGGALAVTGNATLGGTVAASGQLTAPSKIAPNEICQLTASNNTGGTSLSGGGTFWVSGQIAFDPDYNTLGATADGIGGHFASIIIPAGKGGRYRINGQIATTMHSGRMRAGITKGTGFTWIFSTIGPVNVGGTTTIAFGPYDVTLAAGDILRLCLIMSDASTVYDLVAGPGNDSQTFFRAERIA